MKLLSSEGLAVEFEPVERYDFHEKIVAVNALGSYVNGFRNDTDTAFSAADLGVRIAALEHVNDANIKIDTKPLEITLDEAQTLGSALKRFVNSTSEDVRACFQAGNYHGCSIRQVESQIAQQMVEALEKESIEMDDDPPTSRPPGYI